MSRRRWTVLIVVGAALCVVTVVVVLLVRFTSEAPAPFPTDQAEQLQVALMSPSSDAEAGALDPGIRDAVVRAGKPLLPPGAELRIDPVTFSVTGSGLGQVDATLDGRAVRLLLAEQPNQRWLVYATAVRS